MHSRPFACPATPLRWRQQARRSTLAIRQARAHPRRHCNYSRPTRLGCTPLLPLLPWRHSLRPPGQPSDGQCHSLQRRQQARQRPLTGTVNHWSARRHPCCGGNSPCGARLHHAKLGRTSRSTETTQGPRDSDARPCCPCVRGATAYVHRVGPATLSVTHCSGDNRPSDAQCHSLQQRQQAQRRSVSLTAAETTGAQCHSLQQRQPAPRPTSTGSAQRRSVSLTVAETTGPASCTYLNQLCSFVRPFVATAPTIRQRTIAKHPGRTMGCTGYTPFSAPTHPPRKNGVTGARMAWTSHTE
jgi:hypothetical protein